MFGYLPEQVDDMDPDHRESLLSEGKRFRPDGLSRSRPQRARTITPDDPLHRFTKRDDADGPRPDPPPAAPRRTTAGPVKIRSSADLLMAMQTRRQIGKG